MPCPHKISQPCMLMKTVCIPELVSLSKISQNGAN